MTGRRLRAAPAVPLLGLAPKVHEMGGFAVRDEEGGLLAAVGVGAHNLARLREQLDVVLVAELADGELPRGPLA